MISLDHDPQTATRQPPISVGAVEQTARMSDALLDNHLAFLAAHRGSVRRSTDAIEVVGESEEFSAWIPLTPDASLPTGVSTVRLVPSSGAGWEQRLTAAGFKAAEVLVHMEAPAGSAVGEPVQPIGSEADAVGFAEVQSAAFLEVG